MIALIISYGIPYALSISAIFHRCMESKAMEKSMKMIVAVRFFAFAPSIILLTVIICPEVDINLCNISSKPVLIFS